MHAANKPDRVEAITARHHGILSKSEPDRGKPVFAESFMFGRVAQHAQVSKSSARHTSCLTEKVNTTKVLQLIMDI
eukprot:3348338-Amphidinium_carterae.1